jgi:16S rRNA (guanine(966)-N(2))-methyltransferase RsmD
MSAIQFDLPGSRVLDLFAGSGALGIETLSRGAVHATFVENSPRAIRALRANLQKLGIGREAEIVRGNAMEYAARLGASEFDIALADPPYGQGLAARLIELFAQTHFARSLWIEHAADETIPDVPGARTRRYGDTAITSIPAEP